MEVFNNLCQAIQENLGSCFRPGIGRFASADTIVPDPVNPQSLNRYSYVNNNPLLYIDPFGHFGVCFQGGTGDEPGTGFTEQLCKQLADNGDFGPSKQYKVFANSNEGIEAARIYLFMMQKMYPDDPIVVLGYSWGGGAALEFVSFLDYYVPSTEIDALVLVDAVLYGRDTIPEITADLQTWCSDSHLFEECSSGTGPLDLDMKDRSYFWVRKDQNGNPIIPGNVKATLNLYAENNAYLNIPPHDYGETNLVGSNVSNKKVSDTNHCTIAYQSCKYAQRFPNYGGGINGRTYIHIIGWLRGTLGNKRGYH